MTITHELDAVLEALAAVRKLEQDRARWIAESTDEYGDCDIDEEDWIDGNTEYAENIAAAGLRLAATVENFIK